MRWMGFVLIVLASSSAARAASEAEILMREAAAIYVMDANDYIETLAETASELKYWRQKVLQDRFSSKITNAETVFSKSNLEVLTKIEEYLKKNGIESLDDSLMMRLAQLHYDRANFDFASQMSQYEIDLAQFQSGQRSQAPILPAPNYQKTIFFSATLLKTFPNSPLSDWAHYLLGYCLYDEGKFEKGVKVYERMVTKHPYSPLAPEVHWRLAESYFDQNLFEPALTHYRILADTKNDFAKKAIYKQGATYFATGQYEKASQSFIKLFTSVKGGELPDPEDSTLFDESIDYLAHLRAKNVKFEVEEDVDYLISERMALNYRRIQDEELARKSYLEFVIRRPLSKWSPILMNHVIESYDAENARARGQTVRNKFVSALSPDSPYWARHKNDVTATVEAHDLYEKHVLHSAEFYADQARRSQNSKDYDAAINFYEKFLSEYPYSPLYAQARYDLADLQYFAGRYDLASRSFMTIAKDPDSIEFKENAAYGYLLSEIKRLNIRLRDELAAQRDQSGTLLPASALNETENYYLKAAQFYIDNSTGGVRLQKILFKTAMMFFGHNQFGKTRTILEKLLQDKNQTSVSRRALKLIATTYDLESNWAKYSETQRRLVSFSLIVDPEAFSDAEETYTQLKRNMSYAWQLEITGRLVEATNEYEQFAALYPKSPDAPFALFRAAYLFRQMAQIENSNRLLDRVITEYSESKYVLWSEFLKASNEVSLIKFETAASLYENLARKSPNDELSTQALLNAASLRTDMQQYAEAAYDLSQYAKKSDDHDAYFQTAELFHRAGKIKEADSVYARYTTGRFGRDLFVRALFEAAMMAASSDAPQAVVSKALDNCAAIEAVKQRYGATLSARSTNAVDGCVYLKTIPHRNYILKASSIDANIEKSWTDLLKLYARLQAIKSKEWTIAGLSDAGLVAESLWKKTEKADAKKALELRTSAVGFYRKAIELNGADSAMPVPTARAGLIRMLPQEAQSLASNDIFSNEGEEPSAITIKWPSDSAALKSNYDQKNWVELKSLAENLPKSATAYLIRARAEAELGMWAKARDLLSTCSEKNFDPFCAASLLQIGVIGSEAEKLREILVSALKNETQASWNLALAVHMARSHKFKDAFTWAQAAVRADLQYAPSYKFVAKLFRELDRPELAKIVLTEGIKNTNSDEGLQIDKGYLALRLGYTDEAQSILSELQATQKVISSATRGLMAATYLKQGASSEARKALEDSGGEDSVLVLNRFALYLALKDWARAEKSSAKVEDFSGSNSQADYLLGIYFANAKNDRIKALSFFNKARQGGLWGKSLDIVRESGELNRQPTSPEEL